MSGPGTPLAKAPTRRHAISLGGTQVCMDADAAEYFDESCQAFPVPSADTLHQKPDPDYLPRHMDMLTAAVEDLVLPPVKDRRENPLKTSTQMCSVYLSQPDERMSAIFAGGQFEPGSVVLCLAHTWIDRVGDELWVHEGVTADASNQLYHDRFVPPRRVTYFANFFTHIASYNERDEGDAFFDPPTLVTPCSSSPSLEKYTGDKLYTRTLLARSLVSFPITLSFSYLNDRVYTIRKADLSRIKVCPTFKARTGNHAVIVRELKDFVVNLRKANPNATKLVVKPSGPQWMLSIGVKFFALDEIEPAAKHVGELLTGYDHPDPVGHHQVAPGDSILVEEYLATMPAQVVTTERDFAIAGVATLGGASFELVNAVEMAMNVQTQAYDTRKAQLGLLEGELVPVDVGEINPPTEGDAAPAPVVIVDEEEQGGRLTMMKTRALAFRLRVIVSLTPMGNCTVTGMICGIGPADQPLHGVNTVPATLPMVLEQWGVPQSEHETIENSIKVEGCRVLEAIHEAEKQMDASVRGGEGCWTDVIGIDFLLCQRNNMITPFVIEVNDHDCFFAIQQLEMIMPPLRWNSVIPWLERQAQRCQEYLLRDAIGVVVGGGGSSKRFIWECAKKWGMRIILVDHDPNHLAKDKVWKFIHFPGLADHTKDKENADAVTALVKAALAGVKSKKIVDNVSMAPHTLAGETPIVNGVLTFWEDATVVASHVASNLVCAGNSPAAQMRCKSKFECLKHLNTTTMGATYLPLPSQFSAGVACITCADDLPQACAKVPLPAVIKLVYGSSAVGVRLVRTEKEVASVYHKVQETLSSEEAHGGVGLGFGAVGHASAGAPKAAPMLLMEYLDGSEHDIDIVMFNGEMICAFLTDNAPTRLPYFSETAAVMPSQLSADKRHMLAFAAWHCCRAVGLRTGVFNVEMKYTPTGPRLIEINGRMGGFYIRDWVLRLYGIDLLRCAFLCSFGVRPVVPARMQQTDSVIVGMQLYASQQKETLHSAVNTGRLKRLAEKAVAVVNVFEDEVPPVMEYEEPYGNLAIAGSSGKDAGRKLLAMIRTLGFDEFADPQPEYFLRALHCL